MLVNLKEILVETKSKGYAVPGFDIWTFNGIKAVIEVASDLRSPVIIMTSGSCVRNMGVDIPAQIVGRLAASASIPIALHLDHASDLDTISQAMRAGYTSVMYDGSTLPIEQNILQTNLVLSFARALNVSVEAEIGELGRGEEGEKQTEVLTNAEDAVCFYESTQVDALAVAIGTCHGMQQQNANLNRELAAKLSAVVPVPLVLHGSSGVKDEDIQYISSLNFGKINFGTKLKALFCEGMHKYFLDSTQDVKDHLAVIRQGAEAIKPFVEQKILLAGSQGRA